MSELEFILERRSIRRFKADPIAPELVRKIAEAGSRAPSSCGVQPYNFIVISDRELRQKIIGLIGRQKSMEAPVWIMICVDFARPARFFEMLGLQVDLGPISMLVHGIVDACLAAENMALAAEELGLGSVFIGSVWAEPKRLAEILGLPRFAFPILLLCIGYPDGDPPLRPHWPTESLLHENRYNPVSEDIMRRYYDEGNGALLEMKYFRGGIASWKEHYRSKFSSSLLAVWEDSLRRNLASLGLMPS